MGIHPRMMNVRLTGIPVFILFLLSAGCAPVQRSLTWNSLDGPVAQNISVVLVDDQNPAVLYAAFRGGDFFVSTNRGRSWTKRSVIAPEADLRTIIRDPDQSSVFYAATNGGLFLSKDGGTVWRRLTVTTDKEESCSSVAIDPWDPQVLYAAIEGSGLYRSTDGGSAWVSITGSLIADDPEGLRIEQIIVHPSRPGLLFVLSPADGLLRSGDGGESWTRLTERFIAGGTSLHGIAVHPDNPDEICIGTGGGDVYKSADGGSSWRLTYSGSGFSPVAGFVPLPDHLNDLATGTSEGIIVSTDFGSEWRKAGAGYPILRSNMVLSQDSAETVILYGEGVGIRATEDRGETWAQIDSSLRGSSVESIVTSAKAERVYASVGTAVYRFETGSGWHSASEGLPGSPITSLAQGGTSDSVLYASTSAGVFLSTSRGEMWNPMNDNLRGTQLSFFSAHPAITNRLFGMTEDGMYVSTNLGMNWNSTTPSLRGTAVRSMTFNPTNAGVVAVASSTDGVLRSADGGIHWLNRGSGKPESDILAVTFPADDQKSFYAWAANGNAYSSSDQGVQWTAHEVPWKSPSDLALAFDPHVPSSVIAIVNRTRIYYSDTAGRNWTEITADAPPPDFQYLSWNAAARKLFLGTKGNGVFVLSLAGPLQHASGR